MTRLYNSGFSLLKSGWEESPQQPKICWFFYPPRGKISPVDSIPTKFLVPPSPKVHSPTKEQFSCHNPLKTVVIALVPFLFWLIIHSLYTQAMLIFILIDVHSLQNVAFSFERVSNGKKSLLFGKPCNFRQVMKSIPKKHIFRSIDKYQAGWNTNQN